LSVLETEGREYLLQDKSVERGCLVTTDFELIPFTNVSNTPVGHIQLGIADFRVMKNLCFDGKLYAWLHSHPHWKAIPSTTDIASHNLPINMIIYSVPDNNFRMYSNEEVQQLSRGLHDGSSFLKHQRLNTN
jgi:proteasome lid subunit RPN8/RPN11